MRPDGVVVIAPSLDQHLRLRQIVEDFPIQQLVPELAVEALVVAVIPRRAVLDVERLHADTRQRIPHRLCGVRRQRPWDSLSLLSKGGFPAHRSDRKERR